MSFSVQLGPARASWLEIDLRVGDHVEHIVASGVTSDEPVRGLARLALQAALMTDAEAEVAFWLEPAGFWLVAAMSRDTAQLSLYFTRAMHPGVPRQSQLKGEELVARAEIGRLDLAVVTWRALRSAEADLRDAVRDRAWRHELPDRELELLTRTLVARGAVNSR